MFDGAAPEAGQFFFEGLPGHVPELEENAYDPDEARRLLAEAGYPALTINALATGSEPGRTLATIYQDQLAKVGVTFNVQIPDPADLRPSWITGEYDALASVLDVRGEPGFFLQENILGPYNPGGSDPELVKAAEAALELGLDDPKRAEALEDLSRRMAEEPVHVPAVRVPGVILARADVMGIGKMTFSHFSSVIDVRTLGVAQGV